MTAEIDANLRKEVFDASWRMHLREDNSLTLLSHLENIANVLKRKYEEGYRAIYGLEFYDIGGVPYIPQGGRERLLNFNLHKVVDYFLKRKSLEKVIEGLPEYGKMKVKKICLGLGTKSYHIMFLYEPNEETSMNLARCKIKSEIALRRMTKEMGMNNPGNLDRVLELFEDNDTAEDVRENIPTGNILASELGFNFEKKYKAFIEFVRFKNECKRVRFELQEKSKEVEENLKKEKLENILKKVELSPFRLY